LNTYSTRNPSRTKCMLSSLSSSKTLLMVITYAFLLMAKLAQAKPSQCRGRTPSKKEELFQGLSTISSKRSRTYLSLAGCLRWEWDFKRSTTKPFETFWVTRRQVSIDQNLRGNLVSWGVWPDHGLRVIQAFDGKQEGRWDSL
jgi:hypothetical protein